MTRSVDSTLLKYRRCRHDIVYFEGRGYWKRDEYGRLTTWLQKTSWTYPLEEAHLCGVNILAELLWT